MTDIWFTGVKQHPMVVYSSWHLRAATTTRHAWPVGTQFFFCTRPGPNGVARVRRTTHMDENAYMQLDEGVFEAVFEARQR